MGVHIIRPSGSTGGRVQRHRVIDGLDAVMPSFILVAAHTRRHRPDLGPVLVILRLAAPTLPPAPPPVAVSDHENETTPGGAAKTTYTAQAVHRLHDAPT